MLLYCNGGFMQVLEGDKVAVEETFSRIRHDPRHHQIVTLSVSEMPQRHFSNWSMGFKHVDAEALRQFPAHAPVFDFQRQIQTLRETPGLAFELLTLFGDGRI